MKNNKSIKICLAIGIVILFIVSAVTPIVFGYKVENTDTELDKLLDNLRFICTDANGFSEKKYNYYKEKLLSQYSSEEFKDDIVVEPEKDKFKIPIQSASSPVSSGPMNSPWPMQSHDLHHTSQSPYSTVNTYFEKWRFECYWLEDTPVIDSDGTVYFGCNDRYLYAVYPDGTLKWKYKLGGIIWGSSPAIAEDGTIYIGSWDDYLYAVNHNGTHKWRFLAHADISSSPAIAEDGTIYFGTMLPDNTVYAVNPDGTEKWHYQTGDAITSDPAIGDDGTVYIGSCDSYLYALWPDGTLRWRFHTGDEIHGHPTIGDDGAIYIGSWDDYLYALYPDGIEKWKFNSGWGTSNCQVLGDDGTIYVGTDKLYARNPDGSKKWNFDLGADRHVGKSSPAISADAIIYIGVEIGNMAGGEIIAVNSDGTECWRKKIANDWTDSSPSIGKDGTVYIGSSYDVSKGYLFAFGPQESNDPPTAPSITGPLNGIAGNSYDYKFVASDPDRNPISYYVEWGDGATSGWTGDYNTGEEITIAHTWSNQGTYKIRAKARDTFGAESGWNELIVTMPRTRASHNALFYRLLEQYPLLERFIKSIFMYRFT